MAEGEAHVAVREHAHRGQDMAGLQGGGGARRARRDREAPSVELRDQRLAVDVQARERNQVGEAALGIRSEEHTSELQSLMRISYAVFCLKKKKITIRYIHKHTTNIYEQQLKT